MRKNLIFLGTLLTNDLSYVSDRDRDIMKVNKGSLMVMKAKMTSSNMNKLLENTVISDVALAETNNDAIKIWYMFSGHLNECGMMELQMENILKCVCRCKMELCKYYVLGKYVSCRFKTGKKHKT